MITTTKPYKVNLNTLESDYLALIKKLNSNAPANLAPVSINPKYQIGVKEISDLIVMFNGRPNMVLHHTNVLKDFGEVKATMHPHLPLFIFNYTDQATFNKEWRITERVSRGLIFDFNGRVMGRGFDKFFNLGEMPETEIPELPSQFTLTEKLDGSLGITYRLYQDGPVAIATRGSFVSEQAMVATLILHYNYPELAEHLADVDHWCLLFEIIYPANSHNLVVKYGDLEDITLIGLKEKGFNLDYSNEPPYFIVEGFADRYNLPVVKQVEGVNNLTSLLKMSVDAKGIEGWVMSYPATVSYRKNSNPPEYYPPFYSIERIKFKTEEYLQLQKLKLHLNYKHIKYMMMKQYMPDHIKDQTPPDTMKLDDYLKMLPEELCDDADKIIYDITKSRTDLFNYAYMCYELACEMVLPDNPKAKPTKKKFAVVVTDKFKDISSLLFKLYDQKPEKEIQYFALKMVDTKLLENNNCKFTPELE